MQLLYGLAPKIQKTVGILPVVKFLSVVQLTLLYNAVPFQEVLFQVIFSHSGRTTVRIFFSLPAVVFTELFVLAVVITLVQRKMLLLLQAQLLLPLNLIQAS